MYNFFLFSLATLVPSLFTVVSTKILIEKLPVDIYGKYIFLVSLASIISVLVFDWLKNYYIRNFNDSNYSQILLISIVESVPLFFIFYNSSYLVIIASSLSLFLYNISLQYSRVNNKAINFLYINLAKSISFMMLVFIVDTHNVDTIMLLFIASNIASVFFVGKKKSSLKNIDIKTIHKFPFKESFNYGQLAAVATVISLLIVNSDKFIIQLFYDSESLGKIAGVYEFINKFFLLPFVIINLVLFPRLISLYDSGSNYRSFLNRTIIIYISIILFSVILYDYFYYFLEWYFPSEYLNDLYFISFTAILATCTQAIKSFYFDQFLLLLKQTKKLLIINLSVLLFSVVLSSFVVYIFGAIYIYVSYLISYPFGSIVVTILVNKSELKRVWALEYISLAILNISTLTMCYFKHTGLV